MRDLATYITEKAIPHLVSDLKQPEGVPVDSESIKEFFHKRGVNMRYLGKVHEMISVVAYYDKQTNTYVTKEQLKDK